MGIPKVITVPCAKRKGATVDIDLSTIPDTMYEYALLLGLKQMMGRGYTTWDKDGPDAEAKAMEIEAKNLAAITAGTVRRVGAGAKKSAKKDKVHIEALRLAKIAAKEQYRASGKKGISKIPAADWTKVGNAMIDADPDLWLATAMESLKQVAQAPMVNLDFIVGLEKIADEAPAKAKAEKKVAKDTATKVTAAKPAPVKAKVKAKPQASA